MFNLLGPLTNPAIPRYQLLGVSGADLLDLMADSLLKLDVTAALVVHSDDGTDEISTSGPTRVREIRGGAIRAYQIEPEDFGICRSPPESVRGGDVETNVGILRRVLDGEIGPARNAAVVNAGAALYVAGKAETLVDGARLATSALDSGAARAQLLRLMDVSVRARSDVDGSDA